MNWRRQVGILALYGALSLIMTMPVALRLTTHVAGQGGDPWQTMWRFEDALRRAQGTFSFAESEFFGGGEARLVNISVWPWMGLHVAFGQPAAYNLVFLLSYILSGYFMYLLVRYLTKHETAAILAGVLYMFLPYHVAHSMGHFGAMQMQWLPLVILLIFLFWRKPTIWRTLGLAAVVAIQSWTEHHYLLWLAIFGVIFLFFHLIRRKNWVRWSRAPYFVLLTILVFFFGILPWWPMARLSAQPGNALELGQAQTIRFSADAFAYVTPPAWQPLWGRFAREWFGQHFTGNVFEATQFLGWVPLLLIMFFGRQIPRQQKLFWLLVAAVFFVISLGPRLHIFGRVLPVWLPYDAVDTWPAFSAVRAVGRAGVMVGLAASVLFGWVLATQLRRPISVGLVFALLVIEFLFLPMPSAYTNLSQAYGKIANLPGSAIIEIPAGTNYTVGSQALYASLVHGKAVVGNIALERATGSEEVARIRALPALRQLLFVRSDQLREDRKDFFNQDFVETLPDVLRSLDVSVIAVRVDSLTAEQREAVAYFLEKRMGATGEKYENVVLYRLPPLQTDGIFLVRDRRWANVGFDELTGEMVAEIPRETGVTLHNVGAQTRQVELTFLVAQGSIRVVDTVTSAGQRAKIMVTVPPGEHEVVFESLLPSAAIIREGRMTVR